MWLAPSSPFATSPSGRPGRVSAAPSLGPVELDPRRYLDERRFWPTARISWALPIFERPSIPSLAASRRSSVTVIAPAPVPVPREAPRLRAAALAPSRPRAERVLLDRLEIV